MKTKILLAGLALFAFTTMGFAQEATKKSCCEKKTECCKGKEGEKKSCCDTKKTEKTTTTTAKKTVAKPVAKK